MARVLHSSDEVKAAIRRIFRDRRRRRVAIVAFVGKGGAAYLPSPEGLELYCWPQPGGTKASAIRQLQRRKVTVFFADRVHMKVYWARGAGAVVASSNLSDNALGVGGLHEAGVLLPSKAVRIDELIRAIKAKPADTESIRALEVAESDREQGRTRRRPANSLPTFPEWLEAPRSKRWKWGFFEKNVRITESRRAKAAARAIDPRAKPEQVLYCTRGQYAEGDWILQVRLLPSGRISSPSWLYVHRVVLVERSDRVYDDDYPFQAVQALEARHCPSPPFKLDRAFRRALRAAAKTYGGARVERQIDGQRPSRAFLRLISDAYA